MKLAMLKMVIVFEREISYKYSGICSFYLRETSDAKSDFDRYLWGRRTCV